MHYRLWMRSIFTAVALAVLGHAYAQAQTAVSVAATAQAAIDRGDVPAWWKPELSEDVQRDVLKQR